jgi:pimeloyl-ACP methyl ester carboxylesterase
MSPARLATLSTFTHRGHTLAYRVHGEGPRVVVLTHGLLMDGRMYTALAPTLAAAGYRVVTVDMLGHGGSDAAPDMTQHSMTQYGRDVLALLDHLGVDAAVVGGTSLGANVSLEVACMAPARVRALVVEMPVLETGITAAAAAFVPLALALRLNRTAMRAVAGVSRRIPRTHWLVDVLIDFVRREPTSSLAVLDGLTFGRIAPPREERQRIRQPALVFGHPRDPIHPFGDAEMLARELPAARLVVARSIYEWRLRPARLDRELLAFLDEVHQGARRASA